jgi:putative peptidoglycan lipid II flippase
MAKDSIEESKTQMEAVPFIEAGTAGTMPEPSPIPLEESSTQETLPGERRHIVKSATLVMLGNLGSSIMGMVRQQVVASFGQSIASPFLSAITPAQIFNDFLINGSINGALVPTFNDYAAPEKREQLRRLVFTLVNLVFLIMLTAAIVFLFIAPWFISNIQVRGYTPQEKLLTTQFARIIFFSLLALGPFAVLQAALFARKEFGWPAVATAAYHIGIIIGALVGALVGDYYLGTYGLAFGVLLGAAGEIALLLPGLRNQRLRYMFVFDLKQPALRRILKLYAPIALSFLVSAFFIILDQSLATQTPGIGRDPGAANYLAMRVSTTLIQFPAGLVATALSVAVLPTLAEHARTVELERFKKTLLLGFRLGLLLMIPAAAGLMVMGLPIVTLIYQHGKFTTHNSQLTTLALQLYAFQLPFVAIDQILLSAFYARKNTVTPVIVSFVCYGSYLAIALPFWRTIGMPALVVANTVQNSFHAVILLVLLRMAIGPLRLREIVPAFLKISVATAAMVAIAWGLQLLLAHVGLFSLNHLSGQFLTVIVIGLIAVGVYVGGVMVLRVEEVGLMKGIVMAKLGKR